MLPHDLERLLPPLHLTSEQAANQADPVQMNVDLFRKRWGFSGDQRPDVSQFGRS